VGLAQAQAVDVGPRGDPGGDAAVEGDAAEPPPSPPTEEEPPYNADYQRACADPQDANEADLCQQWRSANAAERAVDLAGEQIAWIRWEFAARLVTILATVAAAIAAIVAAKAAQDAVEVARDIGQKQVRAYLMVKSMDLRHTKGRWQIKMEVVNAGQSPAFDCHYEATVTIHAMDSRDGRWVIGKEIGRRPETRMTIIGPALPGTPLSIGPHDLDIPSIAGGAGRVDLSVSVVLRYRTVFDRITDEAPFVGSFLLPIHYFSKGFASQLEMEWLEMAVVSHPRASGSSKEKQYQRSETRPPPNAESQTRLCTWCA
jgi:hypothetical protein